MRRLNQTLGMLALTTAVFLQTEAYASGITSVLQDRRVQASAFVTDPIVFDSDVQQFVAPDHGPFDATAVANASIETGNSSATASQVSSVGAHVIEARGTYATSVEVTVEGSSAYSLGETNVALRFVVPEATTYLLEGFLEATNGFTSLQFSRPFLTVEWFSTTTQHIDLNESGTIDAGTYDLNVTAHANTNTDVGPPLPTSGGYDIRLIFGTATDAPVIAAQRIVAYPNPFTNETHLSIPSNAGRVRIFDLAGRAVRTLQGAARLTWDGRDDSGRALGNGVYWVRVDDVASEPLKVVRVR